MTKWGLIFKAPGTTLALLVTRLVFDFLKPGVLPVTNLITGFTRRVFNDGQQTRGMMDRGGLDLS